MNQPFPKTWWVVEGQFLAGCFPGTPEPGGVESRLRSLIAVGIRTFISLQQEDECNSRTGDTFPLYAQTLEKLGPHDGVSLHFHRFSIHDNTAPSPTVAAKVLDAIDDSLKDGRPVYVHCWGGHGRTGTIVGCWLVRHGDAGADALKKLMKLRSKHPELANEPAPQTSGQIKLVQNWADLDPLLTSQRKKNPQQPDADHEVDHFLDAQGLKHAIDSAAHDFRFQIGQEFVAASDGGTRLIRGFCLGRDGVPLYVVEQPSKSLTTKTAEKAHREYTASTPRRDVPTTALQAPKAKPKPANSSPLLISVAPLSLHDRYLGAMFGLAIGDAVGTTLEFKSPGSFSPISDMIGGGPFHLQAGQWTDDTSMALCLAESLVHLGKNDPEDQMRRYVAWWKHGHLSSTGKCFDIGTTTATALSDFLQTGDPIAGSTDPRSAGNGSLMRLAPVPLAFRVNVDSAISEAAASSRTTHGAVEAVDACRFMTALIIRALDGASKDELLHESMWEKSLHYPTAPLSPKVLAIAKGSYKTKQPPKIRGTGYVVDTLEAALWAFHRNDSFEKAVLAVANLGDDADTTAAVCGQLAGVFYGLTGIPADWIERVAMRDTISAYARGLLMLSNFFEECGL